jgi:hypothetical protein
MKKVFVVSLLLVSIFLIGNAGVAVAQCNDYEQYSCTGILTQYGEIVASDNDSCIFLCLDNFEIDLYYDYFQCYLYPAPDSKHLLGTAYDPAFGWAGCSVDRRGRTITTKVTYIQDDDGYEGIVNCTPCNDCCN